MKLFLSKILFFIFLFSTFSTYTQDQCLFYPSHCNHPENRLDSSCVDFPDHCRNTSEDEQRATEMDPYCERYPDVCANPPSVPSVRDSLLSSPSALNQYSPSAEHLSLEDQTKYEISKMRFIQEFQKNPKIYWAFKFAERGSFAYQYFEDSESAGRVSRDALRTISNVEFNIEAGGLGLGISVPDLNELETVQERRIERQFENFKPEMKHIVNMAGKMAHLNLLCKEQGFNCPAFHKHFEGKNINSQDLANNLEKASEYGQKNNPMFPISKDLEYLQSTYPEEAHFVANMQNLQNKNQEDQIEAFAEAVILKWEEQKEAQEEVRVAHIKANDSFYTDKDPALLNLDNKNKFYTNELEKIKQQISSSSENISRETLDQLLDDKKKNEKALDRIDKAKKLYKHKQFVAKSSAWIGAATAVAQTIGMPKEVVKFGQAAGVGMKIFDAGMSMFISGALDPTGITAIVNGVSALASIFFDIKSAEQIMQESLNRIEKNTEKILQKLEIVLANQEKILGKLDHISSYIEGMRQLMQAIHRENTENFEVIKNKLDQMATDMQFGFNAVLSDHRRQDVQSVLSKAYGYTEELSSNSDNFTCTNNSEDILCLNINKTRSDARIHLNTMFKTFEQISEFYTMKDFSKLSKTEIAKYLQNSSIEDKLPFLSSMIHWLNTAEERLFSEDIDGDGGVTYSYVSFLGSYLKRNRGFGTNNYDDYLEWRKYLLSNINFGTRIPTPLPQNIRFPSYQDEILSEYVKLASLLPPTENLSGNFVHDEHIDQMCQKTESVESLSQIMRENIQRAWTVYHIYSLLIVSYIQDIEIPRTALKLKTVNKEGIKKRIRTQEVSKSYIKLAHTIASKLGGSLPTPRYQPIPYSYRQGSIFSFALQQGLRNRYNSYEMSKYFTNFSNIVNKALDDMLDTENWNDYHIMDYGYIKQVPETRRRCSRKEVIVDETGPRQIGLRGEPSQTWHHYCVEWEEYTIYVKKADIKAFKKAQVQEWSWYPAYVYTHIIRELNKANLIADWMRARLAVATMAQMGYGNRLALHPELSLLNNLIEILPARSEPFSINEHFNPQTKVFSYLELNQIAQFFKDMESIVSLKRDSSRQTFPLIDYAQSTANRINSHYNNSEQISPAVFINQNFCETTDFRITATILNIRNLIQFLNSPYKEELDEKFAQHYLKKEKAPAFSSLDNFSDFLHLKLNRAINNDELFDLLQYIKAHNLQFLVDSKATYQGWDSPPCHANISKTKRNKWFQQINQPFSFDQRPIKQAKSFKEYMKHIRQSIETFRKTVPHGNLSLIYHLPLPSEDLWQDQPVGLGYYEIRHKALLKAELFEHLRPQECQIAGFSQ